MTIETIDEVSEKYKEFDGAVIYDLCDYKQLFLDKFPNNFKFFWLFFGYEIYGKIRRNFISKTTFGLVYPINLKTYNLKDYILRKISRIRNKEFIFERVFIMHRIKQKITSNKWGKGLDGKIVV